MLLHYRQGKVHPFLDLERLLERFSLDQIVWHIAGNRISKAGFWFIDIPRTSSTSTRFELSQQFGWPYLTSNYKRTNPIRHRYNSSLDFLLPFVNRHVTARQMRMCLGHQLWQKTFTFSIVRNPWDRYVSDFFYKCKSFPPVPYLLDEIRSIFKYQLMYRLTEKCAVPIVPIAEFLLDEDGDMIVDFVAKYENRQEDLAYISEKINYPELGESLHLEQYTPKKHHYSEYYDSESRDLVAEIARWEIEKFNYSFGE